MDKKFVTINICVEEFYTADFLRNLANHLEEVDNNTHFENDYGYADIIL